jgi:triphosphoribosyl-dephospho-CoA synthase
MLVAPLTESDLQAGDRVADLARRAILAEVALTPKPGLVDRRNNGAHRDMDFDTFLVSAKAISPWFAAMFQKGVALCDLAEEHFLPRIRPDGLACEQAMFRATQGVNTHKGSIFAFGLLCSASGRLLGQGRTVDRHGVCAEVAAICGRIVDDELGKPSAAGTAGEVLFTRYGMTGARGEAASGFTTVHRHSLPAFEKVEADTGDQRLGLLQALLELLANNPDTNLVARGGIAGLTFVQQEARRMLAAGGIYAKDFLPRMEALDDAMIERNLSPGGSADLLAVTWFLSRLPSALDSAGDDEPMNNPEKNQGLFTIG